MKGSMKESKVKSYTRRTKSGKTITVRAYSRKCEGGSNKSEGAGKELLHKKLLDIADVKDKKLRAKITKQVEAITDGEYSENPYTWKDVLKAARHPAEKSVHSYLEKMGIRVSVKSKSRKKKDMKKRAGDGSSVDTAFRKDYMSRKGEKVIGDKYFSVDI